MLLERFSLETPWGREMHGRQCPIHASTNSGANESVKVGTGKKDQSGEGTPAGQKKVEGQKVTSQKLSW